MHQIKIFFVLLSVSLLFSCVFSRSSDEEPKTITSVENGDILLYAKWMEDFDASDKPSYDRFTFGADGEYSYKFQQPWNYAKEYNSDREYPLIISLHGSTSQTDHYASPFLVGDETEMQEYPCFFLAPNNSNRGWEGSAADWVHQLVSELKDTYRIDNDRIYVVGFSMGGSGSYKFARDYYNNYNHQLFAAIVRVAGMSESETNNDIADKTSIWYHVGLSDNAQIKKVAEEAYQFIKEYSKNGEAEELIISDKLGSYHRKTRILMKDGIEIMKMSEYKGLGHDSYPLQDPAILYWLFSQNLIDR